MTMELIQHIELGSAQPAIEFTSINSGYTDLYLVVSGRSSRSAVGDSLLFTFNGSTSNFSARWLEGDGATVASGTQARLAGGLTAASNTSNTFANIAIYIPNYRSSVAKSYSVDSVTENNATTAFQDIVAGLWNDTSPITSITLNPGTGPNFVQGSSATLYGIKRFNTTLSPKATGGAISYDSVNNKWVHAFYTSGTFTPTENLTGVEYLVIAGGGGGGSAHNGGGGGAGGYRSSVVGESSGGGASAEATLSLTSGVGQTVTVGAGGAGGYALGGTITAATAGSNSVFGSITATGGGRGAGELSGHEATSGGSGGGGSGSNLSANKAGASGTANQGYAGGAGFPGGYTQGAGGGGAGSIGVDANSNGGGNGGSGVSSSITGTSVARAGGGGGGGAVGTTGTGGTASAGGGAGGTVGDGFSATANTGGGGGGASAAPNPTRNGGNGGSGVVFIRYSA